MSIFGTTLEARVSNRFDVELDSVTIVTSTDQLDDVEQKDDYVWLEWDEEDYREDGSVDVLLAQYHYSTDCLDDNTYYIYLPESVANEEAMEGPCHSCSDDELEGIQTPQIRVEGENSIDDGYTNSEVLEYVKDHYNVADAELFIDDIICHVRLPNDTEHYEYSLETNDGTVYRGRVDIENMEVDISPYVEEEV